MKNLYFLSFDSAFYWVRSFALESETARASGFNPKKVFESTKIDKNSALCFNRFNITSYYQLLSRITYHLNIPIIFDIDDLFWDLPQFSNDPANLTESSYYKKVEKLIQRATLITTTQKILAEKIAARFPNKKIFIVPNSRPNWNPPKNGLLIANTDSFKFDQGDVRWFENVFRRILDCGAPIMLLGSNSVLTDKFSLRCYSSKEMKYSDYLDKISSSNFKFGLIPVSESDYANCKSPIKALEFLAEGLQVFASNIKPYQELLSRYPKLQKLTLVDNNQESWQSVADEIISFYQQDPDLCAATLMDGEERERQFAAWQEVSLYLEKFQDKAPFHAYPLINIFNYLYLVHLSRIIRILRRVLSIIKLPGKLIRLFW